MKLSMEAAYVSLNIKPRSRNHGYQEQQQVLHILSVFVALGMEHVELLTVCSLRYGACRAVVCL